MASTPASIVRRQQSAEQLGSRLPALLVAAERVAVTVAQGVHGRRRVGSGEAFWQFRRYQPGDGADQIDWRQTAKTERVFVRENEWEASQSVWIWRDGSDSMRWRSSTRLPMKLERAELLALALSSLLIRAGEQIGLIGGAPRPFAGRLALARVAETMLEERAEPDGLPPAARLPRHAHVALFGDFLAPLADVAAAVRRIAGAGLSGVLVQVLDPAEETLPFTGRTRFEGLENDGSTLIPRVEAVRDDYNAAFAAHLAGLRDIARQTGWTYLFHRTDRAPETTLLALYQTLAKPGYR